MASEVPLPHKDAWNPNQYERFKAERERPFYDLMAMIHPNISTAIDLGCGTGELSLILHQSFKIKKTLGIDASPAMLAKAYAIRQEGIEFSEKRIEDWRSDVGLDLIFSNAALHWIPGHVSLLTRFAQYLNPGGQIAIQMPFNHDHRSHKLAVELARQSPYAEALHGYEQQFYQLPIEDYAALFAKLGLLQSKVLMKVYVHPLPSSSEVVEWVKGSLLTDYRSRLPEELYAKFLAEYSRRLVAEFGESKPYFYTYKRIFLWAMRDA